MARNRPEMPTKETAPLGAQPVEQVGALAFRPTWSYIQTMKAINVSELKAHLSQYLRMASRGTRIVVNDREEPIAQIGPPDPADLPWRERLERDGRLRPGSQNWENTRFSKLEKPVDIQESLRAVREDPDEVRRR